MQVKKHTRGSLDYIDVRSAVDKLGIKIKSENSNNILAWCIFHDDGKNPNLSISTSSGGQFHCFSCGKTGNLIHLVERALGVDRRGAWDFIKGIGSIPVTASAVMRRLDSRKGNLTQVKKVDDAINKIYSILRLPPGTVKSLRVAHNDRDEGRYFHLCDYDHAVLELMIDDLANHALDYKLDILSGKIQLSDFMDDVYSIWGYATRSGYLERFPKQFIIDPVWLKFGIIKFRAEDRPN